MSPLITMSTGKISPQVRTTLEQWGLLATGSPVSEVAKLGIGVSKVVRSSVGPVKASLEYLATHSNEKKKRVLRSVTYCC